MPNKLVNMVIKEVSAVDRAANGRKFLIMKRDYSQEERDKMAANGEALPDGSYPIKDVADLENAIQAYGRAKDKAKAKKHIIARAKALGAEDKLPELWRGGDDSKMSKSIKKKVMDFLKDMHWIAVNDDDEGNEPEGAQDFNTAYHNGVLGEQKDYELDGLIGALWTSIDSIIDDDAIADKAPLITTSVNQFLTALFSNATINKAGKKISKERLTALKEMHQKLGDLIACADEENNGMGDENMAKSDVEFLKGHPAGCMCDDCVTKRDILAKSAAGAGVPDEITKRMEDLEKRNKELEEQIKKAADEAKTKEFIAKAATFDKLGIKADELGPVLKSIAEVNPDGYAKIEATLKAANEQVAKGALFSEVGSDAIGESDVVKRVEAKAKEIQKRDGCTIEKARSMVYKENPELYAEYQKEMFGGR